MNRRGLPADLFNKQRGKKLILIIAEKPSLGRNIAAGIGNMARRDGYLEGNGYIISWAFGHLFSLADIEAYSQTNNANVRWTMDNLPCFPTSFKFVLRNGADKKPDTSVIKQFKTLEYLCNRDDVITTFIPSLSISIFISSRNLSNATLSS